MEKIFITGGTGYMGRRLIAILLSKGFEVHALVRETSVDKLPQRCIAVVANAFAAESFSVAVPTGCTFVQLLGVAHPGPGKKNEFKQIDLASARASAEAAKKAGAAHFVYVSVAQERTNIMSDYQQCRALGEEAIKTTGVPATFIRPWYVVGPGHYWPLFFQPLFKFLEWIPFTSKKAKALRLVTLKQMLKALSYAIENPPVKGIEIMEIDTINRM
ncbi:MAG TPA: SDR family oxidoreductase [Panacibacter sp.]|nr:SDR family oxidoreductase [Panacibacter sp.]HNP45548.1 SDR family oxidoreductase [Panacibacter sp.]